MKIEGGRVKILKKCTEFVIRVIKAHHIPALSDDQSLNLCVKQTSRHEILHLQLFQNNDISE